MEPLGRPFAGDSSEFFGASNHGHGNRDSDSIDRNGNAVQGSFTVTGNLATFVPKAPLDPSASYQIQISGLNDLSGNPLAAFSSSLPTNSVIATSFVLGSNVADLTDRAVHDLPAFPSSSQILFSEIHNSSIYSEGFARNGGVVPPQFRVPIGANQPVYLVLLEGYPSYVQYTEPSVVNQLLHDSRFTLLGSAGRMYVFAVSFD